MTVFPTFQSVSSAVSRRSRVRARSTAALAIRAPYGIRLVVRVTAEAMRRSVRVVVPTQSSRDPLPGSGMSSTYRWVPGDSVLVVVGEGSDVQVGGSDAQTDIATMADECVVWDEYTAKYQSYTMGWEQTPAFASLADCSVTLTSDTTAPEPTALAPLDLLPEPLAEGTWFTPGLPSRSFHLNIIGQT